MAPELEKIHAATKARYSCDAVTVRETETESILCSLDGSQNGTVTGHHNGVSFAVPSVTQPSGNHFQNLDPVTII